MDMEDRRMDEQTDRQKSGWDREMDRQIDRQMDRIDRQTSR